jgi:hypothetical protein
MGGAGRQGRTENTWALFEAVGLQGCCDLLALDSATMRQSTFIEQTLQELELYWCAHGALSGSDLRQAGSSSWCSQFIPFYTLQNES